MLRSGTWVSVATSETEPTTSVLRNRPLITLFLGHMTIDLYAGLLPVMFPLLSRDYNLDLATVGLVALAYSGVGSISQPLVGWLADRYGTRFTGLALIWTAVPFAAIAIVPERRWLEAMDAS